MVVSGTLKTKGVASIGPRAHTLGCVVNVEPERGRESQRGREAEGKPHTCKGVWQASATQATYW